MKLKDLFIPIAFALITTVAIQYFFLQPRGDDKAASDRSFIAPSSAQVAEPLDLDVEFYDANPSRDKQLTEINTQYAIFLFSNDGAIIERLDFKRMLEGKENIIETIAPSVSSKEKGMFLVALNGLGNTPYYYDLIENTKKDNRFSLVYKGESKAATIIKEFVIYDDSCQIDLKLTIEPKDSAVPVRPRIFFSGPLISDPVAQDKDVAVLYSERHAIEKKQLKDIGLFGKENPSIFGLEDHYFINVLLKDPEKFAKRAYYKLHGPDAAEAILQSSNIKEKTTWELSFYCGPKELNALKKVDTRLEDVLDYGWFSFVSKPLLYLLNFLYSIFKNYGIAIIVLTILINLILAPFTLRAEQSRRKHIEAQKKLKYIEQKYRDNPERLAQEKAEFARKHALPGMLGCLPLLAQIPIFIGLNRVLSNAIELYKAPFFGWIHDLSARDPYYVLPILVGVGMILQPAQTGDARQRVTNILIALIIAAVTSNFSAGLALFICTGTFFRIAQAYIQKMLKI